MIRIAEVLPPRRTPLWRLVKQCGVDSVVGVLDFKGAGGGAGSREQPWSYQSLVRLKTGYEDGGFRLEVIESRPPMEACKLGLEGRDREIDSVCELLDNMGRLRIPVWCYEWMPVFNWLRTSVAAPARGGAVATAYDHELMRGAPLTEYGEVSEERLWDNLGYFLERVIPVAQSAGVRLAMHPDDPPLSPIRGLGRIMRSIPNYRRLIALDPNPANGIALCQGNFTLMTDDLPGVIREFGSQGRIFFVHFRDVRGRPDKFVETFHDEGQTDMLECIRAYRDIGFDGVLRPDHVPTMEGDDNSAPGYSSVGRLFAIGYARGLIQAVYRQR
jgi:mannonate dehydratase